MDRKRLFGPFGAEVKSGFGLTLVGAPCLTFKHAFGLVASLLLVARPGAPSSVLAPSSKARSPQ